MFKFGFSSDNIESETNEEDTDENVVEWCKSEQIVPNRDDTLIRKLLETGQVKTLQTNGVQIKYLCPSEVIKILQHEQTFEQTAALKADQNHSDLLPAVYEGGLKVWECTYDLLQYIETSNMDFKRKKILDLGCGAGILGIFTLLKGSNCYFQDYNSDVIRYLTIPNVSLNTENSINNSKFYSGDWQSFSELLEESVSDKKFDYIFTSETIYNTTNYGKLHSVFKNLLSENGVIYLAAKSFYFGVGGGISLFKDYLDRHNTFKHNSVWKCEEGVKREILKIEFTNP